VAHEPVSELYETRVIQSCNDYHPHELTHYRVPWARPMADQVPVPTWPLKDAGGKVICDKENVRDSMRKWTDPAKHGVPIHFGEMGCGGHTPPEIVYAWFNDTLDLIGELNSVWSLWNFRGQFGILDTGRPGTKFTNWHGNRNQRS
jgi:endoglucanase